MDASPPRGIRPLKWRAVIEAVRKLSAAIQPNDRSFGAVADVRGAALAILSSDGRFVSANSSTAAMFGYSNEELIGRSLIEMAADESRQDVLDALSYCASDVFHSFRTILRTRSGRGTAVLVHQHPIADDTGRFSAFVTIFEEPAVLQRPLLDALSRSGMDTGRHYAHLMIGQERERRRISAELHDGIGQALTLIKLTVEDALMRLRRGNVSEATEQLETAVLRVREAIGEMRNICSELRPVLLDRFGLAAALEALCKRVEHGAGQVAVTLKCCTEDEQIPDSLKADIFRIAQEAMNNAVKHGAATEIRVSMRRVDTGILLTIQDNGTGFDSRPVSADPSSFSGLGLIGMQQRVELSGGSFFIQSSGGRGTLVSAMWRT